MPEQMAPHIPVHDIPTGKLAASFLNFDPRIGSVFTSSFFPRRCFNDWWSFQQPTTSLVGFQFLVFFLVEFINLSTMFRKFDITNGFIRVKLPLLKYYKADVSRVNMCLGRPNELTGGIMRICVRYL